MILGMNMSDKWIRKDFQKSLASNAEAAIPNVEPILIPPRSSNIVILEETLIPALWIKDETVMLYEEHVSGMNVLMQFLRDESRVLRRRCDPLDLYDVFMDAALTRQKLDTTESQIFLAYAGDGGKPFDIYTVDPG